MEMQFQLCCYVIALCIIYPSFVLNAKVPNESNTLSVYNFTTFMVTKHNAILTWKINNLDEDYPKNYNIYIIHRSACDMTWRTLEINENVTRFENENRFMYAYELRCPNQLNRISLCANSTLNNVKIPSLDVAFTGVPLEPFFSPIIDPGSFYIDDIGNLHLYWKRINPTDYNGDNYMIRITNEHEIPTNHYNQTSNPKVVLNKSTATFKKDQFNATLGGKFKLLSSNDIGSAREASFIEIPSKDHLCGNPENIKVVRMGKSYNVTWKKPIGDHEITSYTVFWCTSLSDPTAQCDSPIDYERVNGTLQIFTLPSSDRYLKFAVSANTVNSTSGMTWEQCKAETDSTRIGQIESLMSTKTSKNKIDLEWAPKCEDILILKNYTVEHCPVKDMNSDCFETKIIHITNITTHSLDNLKSNTTYKVTVVMQSATTKGPPSHIYPTTRSSVWKEFTSYILLGMFLSISSGFSVFWSYCKITRMKKINADVELELEEDVIPVPFNRPPEPLPLDCQSANVSINNNYEHLYDVPLSFK